MHTLQEIQAIEEKALEVLKTVIDPEVEVNIVDLGLIYNIDYDGDKTFDVKMTLSTPACPIGDTIVLNVITSIQNKFPGYEINVDLTFDPPWTQDMISEEGKRILGR